MVNDEKALTAVFAALADPTRRRIILHLANDGESTVRAVAKPFRISAPAISRHLRVIEKARLLERRRHGRVHLVRARPEALAPARQWLAACTAGWGFSSDTLDHVISKEDEHKR